MNIASFAAAALTLATMQTAFAQDSTHLTSDGLPYAGYSSEADTHVSANPLPRPVRYRDPTPVVKLPATGDFSPAAPQAVQDNFVRSIKLDKEERRKVTGQNLAQKLDDFGDYYDDEMKLRPAPMDGGGGIQYRVFLGEKKKPQ